MPSKIVDSERKVDSRVWEGNVPFPRTLTTSAALWTGRWQERSAILRNCTIPKTDKNARKESYVSTKVAAFHLEFKSAAYQGLGGSVDMLSLGTASAEGSWWAGHHERFDRRVQGRDEMRLEFQCKVAGCV